MISKKKTIAKVNKLERNYNLTFFFQKTCNELSKMEQQNDFIFPHDILEEADAAIFNLLPAESKERYLNVLAKFRDWMRTKNGDVIREEVLLACFNGLMGKLAPPSLWSRYSMLKWTLFVYEKVDISKFKTLFGILKSKSKGYQPNRTR